MNKIFQLAAWVVILAGCQSNGPSGSSEAATEPEPAPLRQEAAGSWSLGPFTHGTLDISVEGPVESGLGFTLFNRENDSVRIDLSAQQAFLPKTAGFQIQARWNVDLGGLTILHGDTTCFQQVLPFFDDFGVANIRVSDPEKVHVDTLLNAIQVKDPADVKIVCWGNSLLATPGEVARPWTVQLAEQIHSQGSFLRMKVGQSAAPASSLRPSLEALLSKRPDHVVVSMGEVEQAESGGAGLAAFREQVLTILQLIRAAGAQPILVVLPPVGKSQAEMDLRASYDMELRNMAMQAGASVVDLWDRIRAAEPGELPPLRSDGRLSQAGHDLLATELATLMQYYLQFGNQ